MIEPFFLLACKDKSVRVRAEPLVVVPFNDGETIGHLKWAQIVNCSSNPHSMCGCEGVDGSRVMAGGVLSHPDFPVTVAKHLELKVLLLDGASPLLGGSQLEFHIHHAKEPARVSKILSVLDPKTGKVTKKSPRCLTAKQSAVIEVILHETVCVVEFSSCKALGRVSLRSLRRTIAVGLVTTIIEDEN
ncbi:uncharacterized protein LOC133303305 isoform X1 [Gastrolobium bilobum]|uniref:uncharacterized protein LOC133303305 isoform X1 n=1 Tax=Gastrolobium bilobum TaxID=150636 RepID=UPI002AAF59B6|nr:uncharacterized protein LOC133303305 isoform X1 [Gastrolobium bilobum]XP_061359182.1 uncharacterized protein LOC133303305 isoform X1 [Gastrolobium bilobum]